MTFREFVFRYRGHLPVPLAILLIVSSQLEWGGIIYGSIIIIFGELFRLTALRSIGGPSRTRNAGAPKLVTWGLYSRVRNPLYMGNVLIYSGLVVFGGGPWFVWLMLLTVIYFALQYNIIIKHEETVLSEKFGEEYKEYLSIVNRAWPSFKANKYDNEHVPYKSWIKTLKLERPSLMSLFSILSLLVIKYLWAI